MKINLSLPFGFPISARWLLNQSKDFASSLAISCPLWTNANSADVHDKENFDKDHVHLGSFTTHYHKQRGKSDMAKTP